MQKRFLMCRPTYFAVTYKINPWMDPTAPYDTALAIAQWTELKRVYDELGHQVEVIDPLPGLPDMVFAANGATVIDGKALAVQFRDAERADEAPAYAAWFRERLSCPRMEIPCEGRRQHEFDLVGGDDRGPGGNWLGFPAARRTRS